jgi:hypothetical protein
MSPLQIYLLRFLVEARTRIILHEPRGTLLRGALYDAVWERFCQNRAASTCVSCPLHQSCAVSALVTPLRDERSLGRDVARPYIIEPPLTGSGYFRPGECFTFRLALFGKSVRLLPYLLFSLPQMERDGLGRRLSERGGQRGLPQIRRVEAFHPFQGTCTTLYENSQVYQRATLPVITASDVRARAASLPGNQLRLNFLTPLRLVQEQQLVRQISFPVLIQRLFQRLRDLEEAYGEGDEHFFQKEHHPYLKSASTIVCLADHTHWLDQESFSQRHDRATPIGGLVGSALFAGNLAPFRELLVWGELTHVGRNAVKGNGQYVIDAAGASA